MLRHIRVYSFLIHTLSRNYLTHKNLIRITKLLEIQHSIFIGSKTKLKFIQITKIALDDRTYFQYISFDSKQNTDRHLPLFTVLFWGNNLT